MGALMPSQILYTHRMTAENCAAEIVGGTTKNAQFNRYLADCSDIETIRNVLQRCQIQRKHGIHNNNAQLV